MDTRKTTQKSWQRKVAPELRKDGFGGLTMADFYFAVGSDPCDVFIVVNGNWIPYKRCDTEEAAQALVIGQNESRRYEDV